MPLMNVVIFTKKFHEIEKKLNTFSFQDNEGNYYWDAVRFFVFNYVYVTLTGNKYIYGQASHKPASIKGLLKKLISVVSQYVVISSFRRSTKNVLFIKCSRALSKGEYIDPLLNPLSSFMTTEPLQIETYPTKNLFKLLSNTQFLLTQNNVPLDITQQNELEKFNQELTNVFELSINVKDIVVENITVYLSQLKFYRKLFKKTQIQQIFMVQNGIQKGLLKAAKEYQIPVNEMQHGYVGYTHPAYSYPPEILGSDNIFAPNSLLTFSDFWKKGYCSPIKNFIVIGKQQTEKLELAEKDCKEVLIISASLYHDNLSSLLKAIADKQQHIKFKYKLHPNQFVDKAKIIEEFSAFINVTVISNEKTVDECLHTCLHVLCIQSTAVYEALQAGSFVYCYKRQDFNYHDNAIGIPGFSLIENADEFIQLMNNHNTNPLFTPTEFFAPYNPECVKSLL